MRNDYSGLVLFLIAVALFCYLFMFFIYAYAHISEYRRLNPPETPKESIEYINTAPAKEAIEKLGRFMQSLEIGASR